MEGWTEEKTQRELLEATSLQNQTGKSFQGVDQSDRLLNVTPPAQCPANEERSSSSGVILSPGFPSNYPNSQTCSWLLRMVPGTVCVRGVHVNTVNTVCVPMC